MKSLSAFIEVYLAMTSNERNQLCERIPSLNDCMMSVHHIHCLVMAWFGRHDVKDIESKGETDEGIVFGFNEVNWGLYVQIGIAP